MRTSDLKETVVVKECHNCGGGMPASDNYCRWCGTRQETITLTTTNAAAPLEGETKEARNDGEEYQTLSSQLVNTLTQTISAKTTPLRHNRFGSNLVAAIICVPILLLIVLLSPLDAYTAARAAAGQLNYR